MTVIHALTENAMRTDAEIGELYGMNKGTVAAVRRRMLDAGAIFFANVPAFNKLGCEIIAYHSGKLDPGLPPEVRTNDYIGFVNAAPQVFHGVIGGGNLAMFTVFKDVTEMESFLQNHSKYFSHNRRPSKARLKNVVFPYSLSRGTYITNFAPTVHRYFGLEVPEPSARPLELVDVTEPDLSENEKNTMVEMVSHPEASDRELSAKVKLSRQAVTRIRNKLYGEGYLTRICVPHLYKWGFEIYVIGYSAFNMEMMWDIRLKSEPRELLDMSFFTLDKADEGVVNHMIPKFQEYLDSTENALSWHHQMRVFEEPPSMTPFSLERSTELRTFDFGPALRNLLDGHGSRSR
jgi:DNA-binding Lrp family transcriptional regulator